MGLRQVLLFLDKLPLRRSFDALKGFPWGSIWKMSGNLLDVRYKLIYRQFESLCHLNASLLQGWNLFSEDGLGEVARVVDVDAVVNRHPVREQL
jgi:hypothetical protein